MLHAEEQTLKLGEASGNCHFFIFVLGSRATDKGHQDTAEPLHIHCLQARRTCTVLEEAGDVCKGDLQSGIYSALSCLIKSS